MSARPPGAHCAPQSDGPSPPGAHGAHPLGAARAAAISARTLRAVGRTFELDGRRPWLMGVVNATPDSFSDDGSTDTLERRLALARELAAAGADILDVGGESARTDLPAVGAEQEIARVAPLIERIHSELDVIVSVDTYKPPVAAAAIAAGAAIVNDVSGLRDHALAEICARTGAALVLMHTRAAPKQRLQDPALYGEDIASEVFAFLRARIERACAAGMEPEQLIVDPGPDFAKTPAQTIALLGQIDCLHALERPLLLAISRKDFVGALTGRAPRERLAGTLAALAYGLDRGAQIFRMHDIAAAVDFIAVLQALTGDRETSAELTLAEDLRHAR